MPALKLTEFEAATAEFLPVQTIQLQLASTRARLGDLKPGFAQGVKKVHTPNLSSVSYLPEKRHLYAGIDTGELRLWDFNAGARRQAWLLIGSHKGSITSLLAVKPASKLDAAAGLVLTGSADSSIKLWDVKLRVQEAHVCVQTLVGHTGTVTSLVHKGACIISSSTDCTIRIWKAVEGRGMLTYPWFEPQVNLFTPLMQSLFSAWLLSRTHGPVSPACLHSVQLCSCNNISNFLEKNLLVFFFSNIILDIVQWHPFQGAACWRQKNNNNKPAG